MWGVNPTNTNASLLKKSIVSFLFFFVCCTVLMKAQPMNTFARDVVPVSPNAAALGKYSDIPIDLSTGVPNISVPIYTVQEGPLSVPLSLSYHASGVKVNEVAS